MSLDKNMVVQTGLWAAIVNLVIEVVKYATGL